MASESGKRDAKQLWKLGVAKVQTQGVASLPNVSGPRQDGLPPARAAQ